MRGARLASVVLALALVAGACSSGVEPATRDRLVIGTTEAPSSVDPATCYDVFCSSILLPNTSEGLVRIVDAKPAPALAESWTVSSDGRTYTFTLRHDVKFHDGSAFTAETMKASLDRVLKQASSTDAAFLLYDTSNTPPLEGIISMTASTADTLVVQLAAPDASFLAKLAFSVGDAVPSSFASDNESKAVVGTGPYRVERIVPGTSIDLVRNPSYWGKAPSVQRVRISRFASSAALEAAVRNRSIDVAFGGLSGTRATALGRTSGMKVFSAPGPSVRFLGFNVGIAPFGQTPVRRAIAAAVNRTAAVAAVGGAGSPLYGLVAAGLAESRDDFKSDRGDADRRTVDAEIANAGVKEPVSFDLTYTPSHYGDGEQAAAKAIKDALEATTHFAVTLRPVEWADFKSSLARGETGCFLLGWYPDYIDADDYLRPFLKTENARAVGSGYTNADIDRQLAVELSATDPAARLAAFAAIQQRVAADVPYVPLWQPNQIVVARGVRAVGLDVTGQLRLASFTTV